MPPTAKVNFTFADTAKPRNYYATTSGVAHEPSKYQNSERVTVDVPNLRSANFNVGNDKLTYTTTAHSTQAAINAQNQTNDTQANSKQQQVERVQKARSAQFSYG